MDSRTSHSSWSGIMVIFICKKDKGGVRGAVHELFVNSRSRWPFPCSRARWGGIKIRTSCLHGARPSQQLGVGRAETFLATAAIISLADTQTLPIMAQLRLFALPCMRRLGSSLILPAENVFSFRNLLLICHHQAIILKRWCEFRVHTWTRYLDYVSGCRSRRGCPEACSR